MYIVILISTLLITMASAFILDDITGASQTGLSQTPGIKVPPTLSPWRRDGDIPTPPLLWTYNKSTQTSTSYPSSSQSSPSSSSSTTNKSTSQSSPENLSTTSTSSSTTSKQSSSASFQTPPTTTPLPLQTSPKSPPLLSTTSKASMISPPLLSTPSPLSSKSAATSALHNSKMTSSPQQPLAPPTLSHPAGTAAPPSSPPQISSASTPLDKDKRKGFGAFQFNLVYPTVQLNAGLVCSDDRLSIIKFNVSCSTTIGKRRRRSTPGPTPLPDHMMVQLIRELGGSIATRYMSVSLPDHLRDMGEKEVGQLSQWPETRATHHSRLTETLRTHRQTQARTIEEISSYLNSNYTKIVRHLSKTLTDILHSIDADALLCSSKLPSSASANAVLVEITNNTSLDRMTCTQLKTNASSLEFLIAELESLLSSIRRSNLSCSADRNEQSFAHQIQCLHENIAQAKRNKVDLFTLHSNMKTSVLDFLNLISSHLNEAQIENSVDSPHYESLINEANIGKDSEMSSKLLSNVLVKKQNILNNHVPNVQSDVGLKKKLQKSSLSGFISKLKHSSTHRQSETDNADHTLSSRDRHTVSDKTTTSSSLIARVHRRFQDAKTTLQQSRSKGSVSEQNSPKTDEHDKLVAEFVNILESLHSSLSKMLLLQSKASVPVYQEEMSLGNMPSLGHMEARIKRSIAGIVLRPDVCQVQGTQIPGTNRLAMCSECAHTNVLDDTHFPRFLTERICHDGTSTTQANKMGCLKQGSSHGGECIEQTVHLPILRRVPGVCMQTVHRGQDLVIDQWELREISIRIGCQCQVSDVSPFAPLLTFD